jgi:hypothetical protein
VQIYVGIPTTIHTKPDLQKQACKYADNATLLLPNGHGKTGGKTQIPFKTTMAGMQ